MDDKEKGSAASSTLASTKPSAPGTHSKTSFWKSGQLSGHGEFLIHLFITPLHAFEHVGTRSGSHPRYYIQEKSPWDLKKQIQTINVLLISIV